MERTRKARQLRIRFRRPVHVRLASGGARARLFAENLSYGGMFIGALRTPKVGTRVLIWFEARGHVLRFAEAEVVFRREPEEAHLYGGRPGFGVRFTRMGPRARALLEVLVSAQLLRRALTPRPPDPGPLAVSLAG